jgi:hypothetical protein
MRCLALRQAAIFRACYIAHGCVSLNFARFEIETLIAAATN